MVSLVELGDEDAELILEVSKVFGVVGRTVNEVLNIRYINVYVTKGGVSYLVKLNLGTFHVYRMFKRTIFEGLTPVTSTMYYAVARNFVEALRFGILRRIRSVTASSHRKKLLFSLHAMAEHDLIQMRLHPFYNPLIDEGTFKVLKALIIARWYRKMVDSFLLSAR